MHAHVHALCYVVAILTRVTVGGGGGGIPHRYC